MPDQRYNAGSMSDDGQQQAGNAKDGGSADPAQHQTASTAQEPDAVAAREEAGAAARDNWLSAWRGLRENPLAHYLPLMLRRQAQRQATRSGIILRVALVVVALTGAYFLTWPALQQSGLTSVEMRVAVAALMVVPAFMVFYFRGLFIAFQACLSMLNRWPGRRQPSVLDEIARGTQLSGSEIVLGLGRLVMPLFVRRVVAAAVLQQLALLLFMYESSGLAEMYRPGAQQQIGADYAQQLAEHQASWHEGWTSMLAGAPATLAAVIIAGVLASALCFLWLLALGRRSASPAAIGSEAAFLAILQMFGSLYGMLLYVQTTMTMQSVVPNPLLGSTPAGAALVVFAAAFLGLGWLALRWSWLRALLPSMFPLAFVAVAVYTPAKLWMYRSANFAVQAGYAIYGWFSSLCIANPLTVPIYAKVMDIGVAAHNAKAEQGVYWHLEPLLIIVVQLLLLPVLAAFARDSVRRFRQGQ
jgi:hypothetical protein